MFATNVVCGRWDAAVRWGGFGTLFRKKVPQHAEVHIFRYVLCGISGPWPYSLCEQVWYSRAPVSRVSYWAWVNRFYGFIGRFFRILWNLNGLRLEHWHQMYSSGYSNISGYSIGIVFGYLFYQHRTTTFPIRLVSIILVSQCIVSHRSQFYKVSKSTSLMCWIQILNFLLCREKIISFKMTVYPFGNWNWTASAFFDKRLSQVY